MDRAERTSKPESIESKIAQNAAFRIFASALGAFLFIMGLWTFLVDRNTSAFFWIVIGFGLLYEFGISGIIRPKKQMNTAREADARS